VRTMQDKALGVGIAGFGSIGRLVGQRLDAGIDHLRLTAVSARDLAKAKAHVSGYRNPVAVVPLAKVAEDAEVVVECASPEAFLDAMGPALDRGRTIVTVSAAALIEHPSVLVRAGETGSRIILASGSVLGLDGLRAAVQGKVDAVVMRTRKPPLSLARSSWLREQGVDVTKITQATRIFEGSAREAARAFPDKFNLAAAVALAGIGPDRTRIEIWLDPALDRNVHTITVEADSTRFEMEMQNVPNPGHEGTGPLVGYSVIAVLQDLVATFRAGT
jgi:aspartate dehydrogenase